MALSWQDARSKVRGDLWRPGVTGVPDDVCDRALHASLLRLEGERKWLWLEGIAQIVPLTADATVIDLPMGFRAVTALSYRRDPADDFEVLELRALAAIRAMVSEGGRYPESYALNGAKAYLDAIAPAGSEFEVIFTASTPEDLDVAVATPVNATLARQQQAVIAAACAWVAGTYLKNEAEEARQERAYERVLERLQNNDDDARADMFGPGVQPDRFGNSGWQ